MGGDELGSRRQTVVGRVEAEAAACSDVPSAIELAIAELQSLLGADGVIVDFLQEDELIGCFVAPGSARQLRKVHPVEGSLSGACLAEGKVLRSANIRRDPRLILPVDDAETVSVIVVPIYVSGAVVGVLRAISRAESFFDDDDVAMTVSLTGVVAGTLARAVRQESQQISGPTRSLYGVGVASDYEDRRKAQHSHAIRYGSAAALLRCQIKGYVTSEILHELNKLIRKTDECFQLDAAEFAILMPGITLPDARIAAGRIKHAIERLAEGTGGITVEWEVTPLLAENEQIA